MCEPLRRLLDKDAVWTWQKQQEKAFKEAKRVVTMQLVLKFYSLDEEVTLQCDASEKGLGATLLQNKQPVAFASRALSKTEQNYAQIEKECLSIVFGCERFRQYLLGRSTIYVESDHKPLEVIFKKPLLSAPKRLQRMLLRLQHYNLDVNYKKGSEMYIADFLSRASLPHSHDKTNDYDIFSLELENMNFAEFLRISDTRLQQIQKLTCSDCQLQTLKTTILAGWPNCKDEIHPSIREFWSMQEELTMQNGIIYKGHRVIIPKAMRAELLSHIHSSHLGAEACLRKARDVVFWPHINADIKEEVGNCATCNESIDNQQKEPLLTHEIPSRPWSKLGIDLFSIRGKDYMVTVDFYSDFWEVDRLYSTTTDAVVKKLKRHFSRYGRPDVVVTDNGPQLVSDEFQKFSTDWEFAHITSSPYHSSSNGKAESAVKIVKKLIRKTQKDGTNIHKAILDWRNTPTVGMNSSPAQRLMSRRTQTLLPTSERLLQPEVVPDVHDKITQKRQQAKKLYDKHAKPLPQLEIGEPVYVKPLPQTNNKTWKEGVCTEKLSQRSYKVAVDGKTVRRNRIHLKEKIQDNTTSEEQIEHSTQDQPTEVRRSTRNKKAPDVYQAGFS